MLFDIKLRTLAAGRTSKQVVEEINKRGYKCATTEYSAYIHGRVKTEKALKIATLADKILSEWESEKERRGSENGTAAGN